MTQLAGAFAEKIPGLSPATLQMLNMIPEKDRPAILGDLIKTRAVGDVYSDISRQQSPFPTEEQLRPFEGFEERRAERAQKIGLESLKEGAKYGALFKTIPQSIATAFGAQAALQLAAAGNVANIYAQPQQYRMDIQVPGYNFQPTKYYGNYTG